MTIKELRLAKGLTQKEAALLLNIPFRTYQNYEYGVSDSSSFSGRGIEKILLDYQPYSETQGIYEVGEIKKIAGLVLASFSVDFAFLFGSYSKGTAKEDSDIDILIGGAVTGIDFFDLQNALAKALHKKVDLLKSEDLLRNEPFINEILKTGVRIYG